MRSSMPTAISRSVRALGLAAAIAAACSSCRYPTSPIEPLAVSDCEWKTGAGCSAAPSACSADGSLPDSSCTPGALNPAVTPASIDATICSMGWTRTIRPPQSYTAPLKRALMQAYGAGDDPGAFELDHLVPLELGGAPADAMNLWPEAHEMDPGSYEKDGFENFLRRRVCARELSLGEAQQQMATDWVRHWRAAGSPRSEFSGR